VNYFQWCQRCDALLYEHEKDLAMLCSDDVAREAFEDSYTPEEWVRDLVTLHKLTEQSQQGREAGE